MGKIFKLIRPKSLTDPNFEEFEYLLSWIGRGSEYYFYMFHDAEFEQNTSSSVINSNDSENIEALISNIGRSINLQASDLSKNDLAIISQIFENKIVYRIKKDGTFEKYAPDSNSFKFRLMDGRYNLSFSLVMPNIKTWK